MSNVASALSRSLTPAQERILRLAGSSSERRGVELSLVGGSVRDILLGLRPADLDLSAAGAPSDFAASLAGDLGGEVVARSQFGTAKLDVAGSVMDLAIARRESYAHPGALPAVSPGSELEDLARRDFTINAMAITLSPKRWATLADPFDGGDDLDRGLIRVLHPGSFADDATRILRAIRYSGRLEFQIEPDTNGLLARDLGFLDTISGDRVRHELERILGERRAISILGIARAEGVLSAIHPALRLEEPALTKLGEVSLPPTADRRLLFVSVLAYSVPASERAGLAARLNMDHRWSRVVEDTISLRDSFGSVAEAGLSPYRLFRLLRRFGAVPVQGCRLATDDPVVAERLERYLKELRHVRTCLNGDELIARGVPEGPAVGKLLEELLAAKLDGALATKEDEERFVDRSLSTEPGQH